MTSGKVRYGFLIAAVASATLCGTALAQLGQNTPNAVQGFSKNRDKPLQIEAATLEVRDKQQMATFSGNVHVVQGDTTMRCKVLVVHYDNQSGGIKSATPGPSGQQQISRLEAKGGVIVTQQDQTATGDTGHFDVRSNTITSLGNVVVSQGGNVVRGERLVVDMTTGVSRVDGGSKGRTQMLIEQNKDGTMSMKPKPSPGR